jgi:hypothetical protein
VNLLNVFLVWLPSLSFKTLVVIPVVRVTIGLITQFMFHPCCISMHILFYFFSALSGVTFLSAGMATAISMQVFCFFFCFYLLYLTYLLLLLYVWVPLHSITLSHFHVHVLAWLCVCTVFQSLRCPILRILNNVNMHPPYRVSLGTHSSSKWGILR